jgi:gamma-glutamylcyclotransferase (GGCT)/AIG2-like uncharacterized protein YtfP
MAQYIFAYGTLRDEQTRRELLGYNPCSLSATIKGFRMDSISIDGTMYPVIIEDADSNEIITGEYFEVEDMDLEKLDAYESSAYRRKKVKMDNEEIAWVYFK